MGRTVIVAASGISLPYMRNRALLKLIPTVIVMSCSGGGKEVATVAPALPELTAATVVPDSTVPGTTASTSTSSPAPSTALAVPVNTAVPPATVATKQRQITVTVGLDSSPARVDKVEFGSQLQLTLTNPNEADEFHLHGYDLVQAAGKAETTVFSFTADKKGTFDVESHHTKGVLVRIEVS